MGAIQIKGNLAVDVPCDLNAMQLNRLRRQFLNYNKMHTGNGNNVDKTQQLFVQFLNANTKSNES